VKFCDVSFHKELTHGAGGRKPEAFPINPSDHTDAIARTSASKRDRFHCLGFNYS